MCGQELNSTSWYVDPVVISGNRLLPFGTLGRISIKLGNDPEGGQPAMIASYCKGLAIAPNRRANV